MVFGVSAHGRLSKSETILGPCASNTRRDRRVDFERSKGGWRYHLAGALGENKKYETIFSIRMTDEQRYPPNRTQILRNILRVSFASLFHPDSQPREANGGCNGSSLRIICQSCRRRFGFVLAEQKWREKAACSRGVEMCPSAAKTHRYFSGLCEARGEFSCYLLWWIILLSITSRVDKNVI